MGLNHATLGNNPAGGAVTDAASFRYTVANANSPRHGAAHDHDLTGEAGLLTYAHDRSLDKDPLVGAGDTN